MAKGGARTRSGPAPDPTALRRERDNGEWVDLPALGREGDVPEWPLSEPAVRELDLWDLHWRKPQALMWERHGQHLEVALYVRRLVEAEQHDSAVNLSTLVRQMSDSLGLTTPGLRSNRWRIVRDEVADRRAERDESQGPSARERLKLASGGDA